jgi:hypothetical protein
VALVAVVVALVAVPVVAVAVVAVPVVAVAVVVVTTGGHEPLKSPWARCAATALSLTSIWTKGLDALPVA